MSKVAIKGANTGTGTFTIESPATNTDRTLTLPDASGTILTTATPGVPVNGPAFSAYPSGTTSVPNNTNTKILFAVEEFDTNSNFASSTFTPTVAGYYQINASVYSQTATTGVSQSFVYKNGAVYKGGAVTPGVTGVGVVVGVSTIVYCNGSTDYIELYFYQNSGVTVTTSASSPYTWFQGALIRSAT